MKFRPLHDRVLIKVLDSEEKTAGGIIIPDTAKEKPMQGKIIAVGSGSKDEQGKVMCVGAVVSLTEEINDVVGDIVAHCKIARLHASLAQ